MTRATLPDGRSFSYTYSARNLLSTLTNPNGTQWSFTYDNGGRLTRITRPGSYTNYGYNARNWITSVQNRKTDNSTLFDMTYAYQDGTLYDSVGNPLVRTEVVDGTTYTTTYRYDAANRQVSESRTPGAYTESYTYDPVGNRLTRTFNGTTLTYSYDDNNKLLSASDGSAFGYDLAGNLTSVSGPLGSWSLSYDWAGRLTSVTYPITGGSRTDTMTYEGTGQRVGATLQGQARAYSWFGARLLEEYGCQADCSYADTLLAGGSYDARLLARQMGGMREYPLYDGIGTVRGTVDETGAYQYWWDMDAFGRYLAAPGDTTWFPNRYGGAWGYQTDPSGLQQLGARYYWPELGRFVSQDPVRDGVDWYVYAGGNPLAEVDPDGESAWNPFTWGGYYNPWNPFTWGNPPKPKPAHPRPRPGPSTWAPGGGGVTDCVIEACSRQAPAGASDVAGGAQPLLGTIVLGMQAECNKWLNEMVVIEGDASGNQELNQNGRYQWLKKQREKYCGGIQKACQDVGNW